MNLQDYPFSSQANQAINELWLQFLWKQNLFGQAELCTTKGEPLKILFPGWFNKSWGPDFRESRIQIGETLFFGDIEIHVEETAWNLHNHQQNEAYNRVILHVFYKKAAIPVKNQFGQTIPSLCLDSASLQRFWQQHRLKSPQYLEELPGACGLSLTVETTKKLKLILQHAAEDRLIKKSQLFTDTVRVKDFNQIENHLYTSICKSLGYSTHSLDFASLADRFPYRYIRKYFSTLYRQNRIEILSRWFGYLGILKTIKTRSLHDEVRREWMALIQKWEEVSEPSLENTQIAKKPSRPLNNPMRRLLGLYYHLESTQFKGLLNSWLFFLNRCQTLISQDHSRKKILDLLDSMFPQPQWDAFAFFNTTLKQRTQTPNTRFIGKQKQLVILVNSIIPFFLAWSIGHKDKSLEKLLFNLLLILPHEGKNRKTVFMENRLFNGSELTKMRKNLSYYQGLIQIHDDCCRSFHEGCNNCSLIQWLHSSS